ncbi:hypothetical protein LZ30DRAFT_775701 [Colletotrichum cereale]|nr:hypothetical protein LZ30DRAFT_775701 [Colletotrichum cereale]
MPFHNSTPASYPVPGDDAIVISSDDDSEEGTGETNDFDHDDSRASGGEANDEGAGGADVEDVSDSKDSISKDSANDTSVARTASNHGRDGGPTDAAVAATGDRCIVQELAAIRASLARIEAKLSQNASPDQAFQPSIATTSHGKRKRTSQASKFPKRQRSAREGK